MTARRALFVANVDWFFLSHRLPLARALRDRGFEVTVASIDTGRLEEVRAEGMTPIALPMTRQGIGVVEHVRMLVILARLYRRLGPDVIHQVAVKPVILGSLVARVLVRKPAVVNSITGFGYSAGSELRARILRAPMWVLYRLALGGRRTITIFQNPDDLQAFVRARLVREDRTRLIRGSGVDADRFSPSPEPSQPTVMFAARMLWEKGAGIFVDAARILRRDRTDARFVLVGGVDPENLSGVSETQLSAWASSGDVEWWEHRSDMERVLADATIIVLPTHYREGLPKILLEAAASGRPVVATDIAGCREIVREGVNGLLVPVRDAAAVAEAVSKLLGDPDLRRRFGEAGRKMVLEEFTVGHVVNQTMAVYEDALAEHGLKLSKAA